jgi:hypothetical protein
MTSLRHKPDPLAATTLAILLGASSVNALDGYVELGAATEHSSNVLRTQDDEQSDTLNSLIARTTVSHNGPTLNADIGYSLENQRYQDDSFDDENLTEGSANINWRVLDDRISLLADHSVTNATINSSAPNTPDNRTRRSILAAGPRFTLHPSPVDAVALTARKIDVNIDDVSESDSERDEASLLWSRRLPQLRTFHVSTSYADVSFDEQPLQDYKLTTAMLGFSSTSAIGTFNAEAGVNKVERDRLEDIDGDSFNINWASRADRSPITWSAGYASNTTDSSIGTGGAQTLPAAGSATDSNLGVVDIIKTQDLTLRIAASLDANIELALAGSLQKRDYDEALLDDHTKTARLSLQHRITPRADVEIYTDHVRQDFDDTDEDLEDLEFGIGGNYSITQPLNLNWQVYRLKRDHSIDTLSFTDNVYRLEITYRFGFGSAAAANPSTL